MFSYLKNGQKLTDCDDFWHVISEVKWLQITGEVG